MQAGTWFTYPGGMEGWVDLVTRKRSRRESNSRHLGPESNALTTEPQSNKQAVAIPRTCLLLSLPAPPDILSLLKNLDPLRTFTSSSSSSSSSSSRAQVSAAGRRLLADDATSFMYLYCSLHRAAAKKPNWVLLFFSRSFWVFKKTQFDGFGWVLSY